MLPMILQQLQFPTVNFFKTPTWIWPRSIRHYPKVYPVWGFDSSRVNKSCYTGAVTAENQSSFYLFEVAAEANVFSVQKN